MHKRFDHSAIEQKWRHTWRANDIYQTTDVSDKPKCYILDMFPYPSGEGLHVGHPKGYIATDIYSRYKRMTGHEVLHPMGWDAFGLPAENFAIKHQVHPRTAVEKNVARFKEQLEVLGFDYDWTREINTTDPGYYKWTQWIFTKLFEQGLAYESHEPINWCPGCQTGLANEDVEPDGTCERCDSLVEQKPMRQWVLKIRQYADRLLEDLDTLEWPEHIKEAQRNWISKSEGAEIDFMLSTGNKVTVFTTRPDTLFGATYMVLAPEHALVAQNQANITNWSEVEVYVKAAANQKEMDRLDDTKEKTGVKLEGITATNPASGEEIPVYIADYVLASYGTGAIMAVPAHDERDYAFAKKFGIEIKQVVVPCADDPNNPPQPGMEEVKRDTVIVHLRDKSTGRYALLDWHGTLEGISTAIMGGVEADQTPEEAALAEIKEEAALTNVQIVKTLQWITAAKYCASHKNQNRCAHAYGFVAEVENLDGQGVIPEAEKAMHTLVWEDEANVQNHLTPDHQKQVWNLLQDEDHALVGSGYLMNSGAFDSMDSEEAKRAITEKVGGRMTATYKIKDWVFSRQRYWGEPIPIVHCEKCGPVAVPEEQLPVVLPEVEHYEPAGDGQSPLATIDEWVNTECPECGGPGKRETNTMPQWAGSSWYYLRYMDPQNDQALVDPEKEKYWAPVDVYVGGDHAVRHLIYARFWHKFLYDQGVVSTLEPFQRLEFLGFILAEDGRKMSKRWGNVINPDDIVQVVGADTMRVYEMFMGPFENTIAWSQDGLAGARRFLERVNGLSEHITEDEPKETRSQLHKTIKKVSEDIEAFKFNTAVSAMMIFVNQAEDGLSKESYRSFLRLLAPFAPHLTEELWVTAGEPDSIHIAPWPAYDSALAKDETVTIGVQINGKHRGEITLAPDATEATATELVRTDESLNARLATGTIKKVIYVPARIINFILTD